MLTEGEKDSAPAHVSEFGRFSKMMEDCESDNERRGRIER